MRFATLVSGPAAGRALVLALVLAGGVPAAADQRDPRLDELFAALLNAPNHALAGAVEQRIWAIWFESPDGQAEQLIEQARNLAEGGDVAGALDRFDRLVDTYPEFAEGWNQRALMRFLSGDVTGSLADIERALELEPRHFGALSGRGQCYIELERYGEAIAAFDAALEIHPWLESVRAQREMLETYQNRRNTPI